MLPKNKLKTKSVLIIHGFTGSPRDCCDLKKFLEERGLKVMLPILPGHSTSPDDLFHVDRHDWFNTVRNAYNQLEQESSQIFVIGVSFGANLAFKLARQKSIDGIVSLGAPVRIQNQQLMRLALPVMKLFTNVYIKKAKNANEEIPGFRQTAYDRIPLVALKEFFKFIEQETTAKKLQEIFAPNLIIQTKQDPIATSWSPDFLARYISGQSEVIWWDDDVHLMIQGKRKLELYRLIYRWIKAQMTL